MPTVIRNKSKKLKIIILFLLIFILAFLLVDDFISIELNTRIIEKLINNRKRSDYSDTSKLFLIEKFDLTKSNVKEIVDDQKLIDYYENEINCRLSAKYYVDVNLCYHEDNEDTRSIKKYGIANGFIIDEFTKDILKCGGNCAFVDIGADYGQFTLFAAKLGKQVLALEPYKKNLLQMHKSVQNDNKRLALQDHILLIQNVIPFNESNRHVRLIETNSTNNKRYRLEIVNDQATSLRTVSFDELINLIPTRSDGKEMYKNLILRLNLNGLERFGLNSPKLFDKFDVKSIYMSWSEYKNEDDDGFMRTDGKSVQKMIDFLLNRELLPLEIQTNGLLNAKEWDSWPDHIVWKKKGF